MVKCVSVPGSRSQQLCLKLEPRGLLYVKLTLQEKWETQVNRDSPNPAAIKSSKHLDSLSICVCSMGGTL